MAGIAFYSLYGLLNREHKKPEKTKKSGDQETEQKGKLSEETDKEQYLLKSVCLRM